MATDIDSKTDSKKCILNVATKLFAKLGLDKCSTRQIAKQSNSNISLISYYFGGKEGLYKEVMRSHALEIKESVQKIIEHSENNQMTKENFVFEIGAMVENMIRFRTQNPEMAQIFAREKLAGMPFAKEIHQEIFYSMITQFYEIFKLGQKNGFVRADINAALFFIALSEGIWGFFEMLDCQTSLNKDCEALTKNHEELKNQFMKIYLTGVLV